MEDVLTAFAEPVERAAQAVVEQGEVHARIDRGVFLPLEFFIARGLDDGHRELGHLVVEGRVGRGETRGVLVDVARYAVADAQFQEVDLPAVFQERFVVYVPARAHRPKGFAAEFGGQSEHVGVVLAERCEGVVTLIVCVSGVEISGSVAVALLVEQTDGRFDIGFVDLLSGQQVFAEERGPFEVGEVDVAYAGGCLGLVLVVVTEHQVARSLDAGFAELETADYIHGVLAEGARVAGLCAESPVVGVALRRGEFSAALGQQAGVVVAVLGRVDVLHVAHDETVRFGVGRGVVPVDLVDELGAELESFHHVEIEFGLEAGVVARLPDTVLAKLLHVVEEHALQFGSLLDQRVVGVVFGCGVVVQRTVVVDEAHVGRYVERVRSVFAVAAVGGVDDVVDAEVHLHPRSHLIGPLVEDVEFAVVGLDKSRVVVLKVEYEVRLEFLAAAAQGDVVLLQQPVFQRFFAELPGEIVAAQLVQLFVELRLVDRSGCLLVIGILYGRDAVSVLDVVGERLRRVVYFAVAVEEVPVGVARLEVHLLGGREVEVVRIVHVLLLVNGQVGRYVHRQRALFPGLFGRDDDDAVRCAHAVDGRCGGIFQHSDVLDVIGVEVFEFALHGKPVDHQQRRGRSVQAAQSADGRVALVGHQTGDAAFEVVRDVGTVTHREVLGVERDGRSGHLLLDDGLVTRADDHLFDGHRAGFELNIELVLVVDRQFPGFEAQERHGQHRTLLHAQLELSLPVGRRAFALALYQHRGACQGPSVGVAHDAADRDDRRRTFGRNLFPGDHDGSVDERPAQWRILRQAVHHLLDRSVFERVIPDGHLLEILFRKREFVACGRHDPVDYLFCRNLFHVQGDPLLRNLCRQDAGNGQT